MSIQKLPALVAALLLSLPGAAEGAGAVPLYGGTELRIPIDGIQNGLEAVVVQPLGRGPHPLAVINHGNPRDPGARLGMSAWAMLPQLIEFARRGFVSVAVMRRGYGTSGGLWAENWGECGNPDYVGAARAAASDIRSTITFMARQPNIDPTTIVSVGQSAGGLATTALTADPPQGLVAAISFAGGRGSTGPDQVCREDVLAAAFRTFGATSRTPMLWIYASNDRYFGPDLAKTLVAAFRQGGGTVDFIVAPPYGSDGHSLFYSIKRSTWGPTVDDFLARRRLGSKPGRSAPESLPPPPQLKADGLRAFEDYRGSLSPKAFAVTESGGYGWYAAAGRPDGAGAKALERCREHNRLPCVLYAVDDQRTSQAGR